MADDPATNSLVQVRQDIVAAQESGDQQAANLAYSRELDLLRQKTAQRQEPAPSTAPGVDDYLYHSGLVTTEELRTLGELEGDPDVITFQNLVGTAVREMTKTGRKMPDDQVRQGIVDDFLKGWTADEQRQIKAAVVNLPRALFLASRFLLVADRHKPDLSVPDDHKFWMVALPVMERIFVRLSGRQPVVDSSAEATEEIISRTEFLDTMERFEGAIRDLQARGRWREANELYHQELAWLAERPTDNRIVGTGGRVV